MRGAAGSGLARRRSAMQGTARQGTAWHCEASIRSCRNTWPFIFDNYIHILYIIKVWLGQALRGVVKQCWALLGNARLG